MANHDNRGIEILAQAQACHAALDGFRAQRDRNKRYNYGDQWSDLIEVDGRRITEARYIREQGNIPLKNNLIRRLVRNVIGVYSARTDRPVCLARDPAQARAAETMTTLLQYNAQVNRISALYTRTMEEFLISGMAVHKKTYGRRGDRTDCWTDYVQPNNFFFDTMMRDFRGWDCTCVGEIHHVTADDVCRQFATDARSAADLRRLFGATRGGDLCTVTEVWRRESRERYRCHDPRTGRLYSVDADGIARINRENQRRQRRGRQRINVQWCVDDVWRYYFIAPSGVILAEGDSPYAHRSHPYVFKVYPMIDGEVHSFVADVIDQQRYTNRLITLHDWIMRASAKGVLLVPEDCVPRGCSPDDFADSWSRYNGVIFYKPSAGGAVPQQVSANSTAIGIKELLDVQLKFFEEISGVNTALQGKTGNVGMSAELYGQQTQNATTSLLDILDTFDEFVREAAYKDMHNLHQYYSAERVRRIVGTEAEVALDDVEFDLDMQPSSSSPAYKQSADALLMEIWRSGQISLADMLRAGNLPFAPALLSALEKAQ